MKTFAEYQSEIDAMKARHASELKEITLAAEAARQAEISNARQKVEQLARELGVTPAELFANGRAKPAKAGAKVDAKYKNPNGPETWTGRGREPSWIRGKNREDFAIAPASGV